MNTKWYKKYFAVYGKSQKDISQHIIDEIKSKISTMQSDSPLISCIIIAHNGENHLLANLWSLSDTICQYPIEIIGIDKNSTDGTADIYKATGVIL